MQPRAASPRLCFSVQLGCRVAAHTYLGGGARGQEVKQGRCARAPLARTESRGRCLQGMLGDVVFGWAAVGKAGSGVFAANGTSTVAVSAPSASFKRPVVILGPVADIAMQKLTAEMPDQFEIAGKKTGPSRALLAGRGLGIL